MSTQTENTAVLSTSPETSSPENGLMATLQARPPLAARAGALAVQRRQQESRYRLGTPEMDETAPVNRLFCIGVFLLRNTLKALGLYRRGVLNARDYRVVRHDIVAPGLPEALDGFRILQVSDLHLPRRHPAVAHAIGAALAGTETDLCVLTGDYRFGYFGPANHVVEQLRVILADVTSRYGTVGVLGNHDTFSVGQLLDESGFPLLYNEGVPLSIGPATLWLCGIDESHNYGCDRVDRAVADAPEDAYILLLAHTPERIQEAEAHGVACYLAGHTHGGQIRLPLIGPVIANADCASDQVWGPWRHKNMVGYTTSGIGATDVPVRFNCPPEAALITLRCTQPENSNSKASP